MPGLSRLGQGSGWRSYTAVMSSNTPGHWLDPGWRVGLAAGGWLLGLALQMQQSALWTGPTYAALAALAMTVAAALTWPGLQRGWPVTRTLLAVIASGVLGLASTGWRAEARLAERLDPTLEGQDLNVTGVVAQMTQTSASGTRFVLEVEQATLQGQSVRLPPLLALGWYVNYQDEARLADPRTDLRAGQRWQMPLRLKLPHATLNPNGYDAELAWFEQGLGATGYVRWLRDAPDGGLRLLASGVAHPVERLRQHLRDAILRAVPDGRAAGVLAALVVGDQSAIERDDWSLFRQTGIAHLVSISGVHVTMFAWLAGLGVAWIWRRSAGLMLWRPAPLAGRWVGLALAVGYAMLAGWGVPAQRTVIMLATVGVLRNLGRRWPWPLVLLSAAVAVTLLDPWAILQPGFWLSFAAVGLLMVSGPEAGPKAEAAAPAAASQPPTDLPSTGAALPGPVRPALAARLGGALGEHMRGQLIATLGLAPLSLVFFQQISLVGFAANLVAIPLVTLVITPLALLGALLPPLWTVAAWAVQALIALLGWLATWPGGVHLAPAAPGWAIACGLLGAVLGVLPVPWALRALALPLALPLLWPPVQRPAPGSFEMVAADVGQGTAVLLRTRHHLLLYDTGPQYSLESDAGQRVLLPLLASRGERRIDLLMLSHRDGDHVGGAASLLAGWPVAAISSSLEAGHPLLQGTVPQQRCESGQRWEWDGVHFEVLHPTPDEHAAARKSNAVCCVLRVQDSAGRSVLLTGDIEAAQEAALIARWGSGLASDVLMTPHHGSRTSSSAAFLDAVAPATTVVQAGYRSRYGHPAPDVMARYTQRAINVVRTDQCGAWLWQDGRAMCTRDVRRRYWHWSAPVGGAEVANHSGP